MSVRVLSIERIVATINNPILELIMQKITLES
jgi:hypothetical protein